MIGSICDILSSLNFQAYGLHEANPLMQDKNKMFAEKRNIVLTIGLFIGVICLSLFVQNELIIILIIVGTVRFFAALGNWKARAHALEQIGEDGEPL